jgi:AbrB family looped-hinge helix DNA binding protein
MPKITDRTVLTKKSQITLPKRIREFLKLKPGDQVKFVLEDNVVQIVPVRSRLEEGFGKVRAKRKPEDFKRIREIVEEEIAEEVLREF